MKYRWLVIPLMALRLLSPAAPETVSVDFPNITMTELGKNLPELFPMSIEFPANFVDFKKTLLLSDVTWDQIVTEAFDGSDYYCVLIPGKAVVLKKGDRTVARYREFLTGTWGPQRNPDTTPIDELQREFRADGTYEVNLVPVAGDAKTGMPVARGKWTLQETRLEISVTEVLDPTLVADAAAGIWEIRSFRNRITIISNPRSGLSLLLQRRDLALQGREL